MKWEFNRDIQRMCVRERQSERQGKRERKSVCGGEKSVRERERERVCVCETERGT